MMTYLKFLVVPALRALGPTHAEYAVIIATTPIIYKVTLRRNDVMSGFPWESERGGEGESE